ncbi:MAG: hypothetical protein K0M56_07115 [Kaistella sp.]|nr:hypothetical protein [Kaistella sp.]
MKLHSERIMARNWFLFLFFLSFCVNISAQEKTLLKILNRELKKEVKHQLKSPNFNGDTITIVEPFTISNEKILSFKITKTSPYFTGVQVIKQEVPLSAIKNIGKDINIIFETPRDSVTVTTTTIIEGETKEETIKYYLFFPYLSNEKNNENLGIEIQNAFKKAGFIVTKEYWYD